MGDFMKKTIILLILVLLTSCHIEKSVSITRNVSEIYVQFESVFDYNTGYFYFYMDGCVSCDSLKNHIVTYALNNNDFYLVIPSNKFNYGYDRSFNNGVTNYQDIVITGFPTLLEIKNYQVSNNYVGVNEISNLLFD